MPLKPDHYAVIGNPIAHSLSPTIHALFAAQTGQAIEYGRLLAPLDGWVSCVEAFRQAGGRGLNVTVPFKTMAHAYATVCTERARHAGAVNTLTFWDDRVEGDNTDGVGLVRDLVERIGVSLAGARVLIVGAGGAARGVVMPLLEAAVARVHVANRNEAKARSWVAPMAQIPLAQGRLTCSALEAAQGGFEIIINATSAGLDGTAPLLAETVWYEASLALDLVYGDEPTPFMAQAQAAGCACVEDGLGMLVAQAAVAFEGWRGVRPDMASVYAALRG
jgi:shikimate dehydrogenase